MKNKLFVILFMMSALVLMGQSITVTSPNGGESWAAGSTQTITWTTTGITSGQFRIALFDGATSVGTIASYLPITQNSFSWTVGHLTDAPDVGAGTNYKIKIRIISEAPNDFSDATFSITSDPTPATSITVTSPNGGENWQKGSSHNITWTTTGISAGTYQLTLWRGGSNLGVIASGLSHPQNSFPWTVGNLDGAPAVSPDSGYTIKVRLQGETANDFSNGPFTIGPDTPTGTISVTSPDGDSWHKDSTKTISWNAPGISSGTYRITLRKGGSQLGVVATGIAAATHSYSWKVGELMGIHPIVGYGSDYVIRVELTGESNYADSNPFSIVIRIFPPWLEKLKQYERLRIPWWIDPPGPDPDPWEGINLPFDKIRDLVKNPRNPVNVGLVQNGKLLGILGQFKGNQFIPGGNTKLIGENGLRFKLGRGQLAEFSRGGSFALRFVNAQTGEVMFNMNVMMEKQMLRGVKQKFQR